MPNTARPRPLLIAVTSRASTMSSTVRGLTGSGVVWCPGRRSGASLEESKWSERLLQRVGPDYIKPRGIGAGSWIGGMSAGRTTSGMGAGSGTGGTEDGNSTAGMSAGSSTTGTSAG